MSRSLVKDSRPPMDTAVAKAPVTRSLSWLNYRTGWVWNDVWSNILVEFLTNGLETTRRVSYDKTDPGPRRSRVSGTCSNPWREVYGECPGNSVGRMDVDESWSDCGNLSQRRHGKTEPVQETCVPVDTRVSLERDLIPRPHKRSFVRFTGRVWGTKTQFINVKYNLRSTVLENTFVLINT